jgi:hypothetical protein
VHYDLDATSDESSHALSAIKAEKQNTPPGPLQSGIETTALSAEASGVPSELYCSGDDYDDVPSNWEDRASPFPEEFSKEWHYQSLGDGDGPPRTEIYGPPYGVGSSGDGFHVASDRSADADSGFAPPSGNKEGSALHGDLGFMANTKGRGGKRRTKFRPMEDNQVPAPSAPRVESRGMWVPDSKCTNCQSTEHLRKDCPKPQKHILLSAPDYGSW